jgi:hypothetical protein
MQIAHRYMNVEIGAEAALFPEKEYTKGIFVALYYCSASTETKRNRLYRSLYWNAFDKITSIRLMLRLSGLLAQNCSVFFSLKTTSNQNNDIFDRRSRTRPPIMSLEPP